MAKGAQLDAAAKDEEVGGMWLFGYPEGSDDDLPLKLQEVTIAADAGTLRRIARFLEYSAVQMEKYGPAFGHEHLADFDQAASNMPSLIVVGPRSQGPDPEK